MDPRPLQRDFLIELEDARRVDSVEMQAVVNRLPANELLAVSDVAAALNVSIITVYGLIDEGELKTLNLRTGRGATKKPYYRVIRTSVLNYLRKHIS